MKHDYNRPTPSWLLDIFEGWYDPCPLNPDWILDGLGTNWPDGTYINPPYKDIKKWVAKAISSGVMVVMLLPVDVSTEWFAMLHNEPRAHMLWFYRRVYPNCRGNMLVIIEHRATERL